MKKAGSGGVSRDFADAVLIHVLFPVMKTVEQGEEIGMREGIKDTTNS